MFQSNPFRGVCVVAVAAATAIAVVAPPATAQQTGSPAAKAAPPAAAAQAPDSTAKPEKSRLGRFGHVFRKAVSTASEVGAKAGISKETAARLAVTAATGGAGAALMQARLQSASSAAALVTRSAVPSPTAHLTAPGAAGSALAQQAVAAMTDLATISQRAAVHDPAAVHAMQVLDAAMAKPDAQFVALQKRTQSGDPTAAQQMIIREDAIARAAMGSAKP